MYVLKESNDIFQDILLPFSVRQNERFFYQIIGVPDNETEYYNNLYQLECNLSQLNPTAYYRYNLTIENGNMTNLVETIRNSFKFKDITQKDFIFTKCFDSCGVTSKISSNLVKDWKKAFCSICNKWYDETSKKKTITFDMLISFGVKMSSWLSKISNMVCHCINNMEIPKTIFYGCEKEHEIYFMELLFNLGFDVLYINTKEIQNLICKNKIDSISKKIEYEKKSELPKFPTKERVVSYETNALKAQNEVNDLYYDGESSLKPWQLQECSTRNIPLKTTYEELLTLWTVESNMRPQFKVQNKTVYIPNLCCKINGVENDIKDFIKKIEDFNVDNCLIFENSSLFTILDQEKNNYNFLNWEGEEQFKENLMKDLINEVLQANIINMVDNNGEFYVEQLKNKRCYHYGYLSNMVQTRILDMIKSKYYSVIENNQNQKELVFYITILLNLDKRILNLMQNFDYGYDIPKIILYHSNEFVYKEQDEIILKALNEIGFDILAITPTRYCDIDNIFPNEILNIFSLEKSSMNLKSPFRNNKIQKKKGLFERIF